MATMRFSTSNLIKGFLVKFYILKFFKISLCLFKCEFNTCFLSQSNKFFWGFTRHCFFNLFLGK